MTFTWFTNKVGKARPSMSATPTALLGNQCAPPTKAERKVRSGVSELFGAIHFRQSNTSGRQLITSPQVLLWVCGSSVCHSSTRDILRQQRNDRRPRIHSVPWNQFRLLPLKATRVFTSQAFKRVVELVSQRRGIPGATPADRGA